MDINTTSGCLFGDALAAFISWLRSPDNNRAPGMTCLEACERLARGVPWQAAGNPSSKGCGANMRVAPVGLLPDADMQAQNALAQFLAAITHAHPTALAASDLTAFCVRYLAQKNDPIMLVEEAQGYALGQRSIYNYDWLGSLWERSGMETPESYIARGGDECLSINERRLGFDCLFNRRLCRRLPGSGFLAKRMVSDHRI